MERTFKTIINNKMNICILDKENNIRNVTIDQLKTMQEMVADGKDIYKYITTLPISKSLDLTNDITHNENYVLDENDVDLVMVQTDCTREVAVSALNKNKGDIVNAIMDITL